MRKEGERQRKEDEMKTGEGVKNRMKKGCVRKLVERREREKDDVKEEAGGGKEEARRM